MNNLAENIELETAIEIPQKWLIDTLKVALNFAAKKDVRYYLNGLLLEFKQNELAIVATDGHRLFFNDIECFIPDNLKGMQYILNRDSLTQLKSFPKVSDEDVNATFEIPEPDSRFATIKDYNGQQYMFETIDGKFPDYQRVMWRERLHEDDSKGVCGINLSYLADLAKLKPIIGKFNGGLMEMKGPNTSIRITAQNTISNTDILVFVMPMRV